MVKVTSRLTPDYARMIEASPFAALATVGPEGLDCSPRGDDACVVRIADDRTVLMPDWRGNNRVDSLANIVRDPRVALMFLVPGSTTTMRINGTAVVSVDPDLTQSFEVDGKHPAQRHRRHHRRGLFPMCPRPHPLPDLGSRTLRRSAVAAHTGHAVEGRQSGFRQGQL